MHGFSVLTAPFKIIIIIIIIIIISITISTRSQSSGQFTTVQNSEIQKTEINIKLKKSKSIKNSKNEQRSFLLITSPLYTSLEYMQSN